jgi:D-alanyl-D-alanine carboxypeptidase
MRHDMTLTHAGRLLLAAAAATLFISACGGGGSTTPDPVSLPAVSMSPVGSGQPANAQVDAYVQTQLVAGKIPGLSLAVLDSGRLVYAKAYGYADLNGKTPLRPEDRMEVGSISKTFVVFGAMLLAEEGKLDLDARISNYIGPVLPSWEAITVRHLLNHTSGLPEYPDDASRAIVEGKRIVPEAEILTLYKQFPATRAAGASWSYSNVGMDILGIILSRVSGRYYGDYLKEKMFLPLGMRDTRIMAANDSTTGIAVGYAMDGKQIVPVALSPSVRNYLSLGASGVEASVLDMAKYETALRSPALLRQTSLDALWTSTISTGLTTGVTKAPVDFGLGWFLSTVSTHRTSFHSGGMPGYISYFVRYQDAGISVIVLTNQGYEGRVPMAVALGVARMYHPGLP